MNRDRSAIMLAAVVAFAVGFSLGVSPMSPIHPKPNRPVLRAIASFARYGLWMMWWAEPAPRQSQEAHLVHHSPIGEDGYPRIDHRGAF